MNGPDMLENRTFDEIIVGDIASVERTLREQDMQLFARVTGDANTRFESDIAGRPSGRASGLHIPRSSLAGRGKSLPGHWRPSSATRAGPALPP